MTDDQIDSLLDSLPVSWTHLHANREKLRAIVRDWLAAHEAEHTPGMVSGATLDALLREAQRAKWHSRRYWKRWIDGTPPETDVAVRMATFASAAVQAERQRCAAIVLELDPHCCLTGGAHTIIRRIESGDPA